MFFCWHAHKDVKMVRALSVGRWDVMTYTDAEQETIVTLLTTVGITTLVTLNARNKQQTDKDVGESDEKVNVIETNKKDNKDKGDKTDHVATPQRTFVSEYWVISSITYHC